MIGLENVTLQSARLEYRLLNDDDREPLSRLLQDPAVTEPGGFRPAQTPAAFDAFYAELTQYHTAIAILHQQELIGYLHVNKYVVEQEPFSKKRCVSVGFAIGKAFQNQGFGTEALKFLTEYLLTRFDACFADHFIENLPSQRVIEKSGYSYFEEYKMFFDALGQEKTCRSYVRLSSQ